MTIRLTAALTAALALAACGGGGGGGSAPPPIQTGDGASLTGGTAPAETAADRRRRSAAILSAADAIMTTTLYGDSNAPGFESFAVPARCSGTQCSWTLGGVTSDIAKEDFAPEDDGGESVLTKRGITTIEWRAEDNGFAAESYGAWMQHSAFAI